MTTLKVNLSAQLQTALSSQGVYAYAVYFDPNNNGTPVWHNLVVDGAVQSSGTVDIPLPTELKGGKIYFLVQSREAGEPANLPTVITQESDISFKNAADQDFRYDSFEVTLESTANDVGNLTSVNGFGLPMEVSVTYSDGSTDTRGYKVSANDLFQAFEDAGNTPVLYTEGPLNGQNRGVISPSEALAQVPPNTTFKASDWDTYIASLQVEDPDVEIAGFFNGAADANGVYHNAGFFSYALEWDSAEAAFWLSPAANSEIKGFIKITPADLANSIYSTLGDVGIYASKTDTEPYRILNNTDFATGEYSMNTGENNQWGAVLANFLTGFTAGFYGTSGKSLNPLDTAPIDLNDNWNWDPSYAFSKNLTAPPDPTSHFQDAYSEFFFFNSNSYGSGYSDNLMRQYSVGGPLIDVSNPTEPDKGQNVSEIGITLFADNETPTGYVTPEIYNYIAPNGGKYVAIDGNTPTGNNIKFNFANARMVMSEDTAISLDMITGWTTGGEPIWTTIAFDAPAGQSPWQNWTLVYTPDGQGGGTWSAQIAPNTSQGPGNLLISNFQTPEEGKYWYRLNIGEGADKKTYNLYYEAANDPDGKPQFLNPNFGSQQGGLAIDGLATIAGPAVTTQTVTTFTVNLLYGATNTLDPDVLERNPSVAEGTHGKPFSGSVPFAPVAGTIATGNVFQALDGQTVADTNTITTSEAQIAFGWTGLNDGAAASKDWIKQYTNKIGALNTAKVDLVLNGQTVLSLTTSADLDGQWRTPSHHLGNGEYTITMSEFAAADAAHAALLGLKSEALTLTVATADLDLAIVGGGSGPDLDGLGLVAAGPDGPSGNWIELQVVRSSPFSDGAVILVYATNEQGDLVSRDGLEVGPGVTIEDATLATIGTVRDDAGRAFLKGAQSVYLQTGLELHFAVLKDDEEIDRDADVTIAALPDGRHKVVIGGYTLITETENDHTDDVTLAAAQRLHNQEFVYLDHGATVDVDVFGSAANTNTLGFVRMDLDPTTGDWSVGGVDYGNTDAFKNAVVANLDANFLFTKGGNFSETQSWTIAGDSGYYAPVLLTQNGDVFVVGYGNPEGNEYIRTYGHNTFGFEDLTGAQGSDFDYNDMVVRVSPEGTGGGIEAPGGSHLPDFLRSILDRLGDRFDFGHLSDRTRPIDEPEPMGFAGLSFGPEDDPEPPRPDPPAFEGLAATFTDGPLANIFDTFDQPAVSDFFDFS